VGMTLHVDYGGKQIDYPHLVEFGCVNNSNEVHEWCKLNFKPLSYYYSYDYGGWYFVKEKDAMFFSLRWA
jgi:hypothetical protein